MQRGVIKEVVMAGLIKKGHSVWSNACAWHGTTIFDLYDSEVMKAPLADNTRITVKEATEAFIFKKEQVVAIDPYSWPFNR